MLVLSILALFSDPIKTLIIMLYMVPIVILAVNSTLLVNLLLNTVLAELNVNA
jgi:hypothetical protein